MTKDKGCPNCGSPTSMFHTSRYFSCGEAVCECKKCGYLLSSSKDWGKK